MKRGSFWFISSAAVVFIPLLIAVLVVCCTQAVPLPADGGMTIAAHDPGCPDAAADEADDCPGCMHIDPANGTGLGP